ncbi:hypothetical protein G6011_03784 [Alternaria panax]|uniref:Heterokaryon incompatibility domain-containing protein n=1 Tax=Alternaria panax TaxID=48097 RepID=A0AAD4NTK0_9PLEO|nr:hypothetical protein G6011_03784 [Alternaria panax]
MISHTFHEEFPLPSDEKSIRVLRIKPGIKGTAIEASLFKIDLNDPNRAPYTTLSYTWGDSTTIAHVQVNEEVVGVGGNLFQALQHIRSPDVPIVIWVDAICIDQTDNAEKSHQVSHMDLVYRLCDQVYIWLGLPDGSIPVESNPFALVEHFAANKHFYNLPGYRKDNSTKTWACDTSNKDFTSLWKGFGLVARSPWWHRAWTVQEAVLPAKAMVVCGIWRIPWESFDLYKSNKLKHIFNNTRACCADAYEAIGVDPLFLMDQVMGYVATLKRSRRGTRRFKTFSDVSFAYMNRQCFNPRDKIYSLLGFADSATIRLSPDYAKEVSDVYVEAFCKMLEEIDMSPRCLLGEGFNSERFNLPSWVRDFSAVFDPRSQHRRAQMDYHLFKACGDLSGKLEVKDQNKIVTHGVLIDRVKALAMWTWCSQPENFKEILDDWRRTCDDNGVPVRSDQTDHVFARVLCGGVTHQDDGRPKLLEDIDLPDNSEWSEFLATGNGLALCRKHRIACATALDRKR